MKATKKPNKEKNDLRSVMKSNPTLTQEILSVMLKQPADVASIILKDYKTHVSKKKNPIKKTELDPGVYIFLQWIFFPPHPPIFSCIFAE